MKKGGEAGDTHTHRRTPSRGRRGVHGSEEVEREGGGRGRGRGRPRALPLSPPLTPRFVPREVPRSLLPCDAPWCSSKLDWQRPRCVHRPLLSHLRAVGAGTPPCARCPWRGTGAGDPCAVAPARSAAPLLARAPPWAGGPGPGRTPSFSAPRTRPGRPATPLAGWPRHPPSLSRAPPASSSPLSLPPPFPAQNHHLPLQRPAHLPRPGHHLHPHGRPGARACGLGRGGEGGLWWARV